jgi:transposase
VGSIWFLAKKAQSLFSFPIPKKRPFFRGQGLPKFLLVYPNALKSSFFLLNKCQFHTFLLNLESSATKFPNGVGDFWSGESMGYRTSQEGGEKLFFPPEVAVHLVKLACERPETAGRSLSQWDCNELAQQLVRDGLVKSISPSWVQKILSHHKLKPWRNHMWLSAKYPRDAEFYNRVENIINLYTRDLSPEEVVLCVDEKTSLQPRIRLQPTKPPLLGNKPNLVEHEYKRDGALQLFAAFNTRSGEVFGKTFDRKRQVEFIEFLEALEKSLPAEKTVIHLVMDNVPTHHGKKVREWLKSHPRFCFHFTPVHCSWLNQVEQWFGILQRKRFRIADFSSKKDLAVKIAQFTQEWNEKAHPFNWTKKSVAKIMADAPEKLAA